MKTLRYFTLAGCALMCWAQTSVAQGLKTPAPSPAQTIKQDFALSSVEVSYSRPAIKGRTVMGDLVPYGKVWRTGANNATTITFGEDVIFGGTPVKAGKYGLLTIPGQREWTVILSKSLDVTSPSAYKQENDVVRVKVAPVEMPFAVESFMINFDEISADKMTMMLLWDRILVPVEIKAEIDGKIAAAIDAAMKGDKKPYFQAAMFYMETGRDKKQALAWLDAAAKENPKAFWVFHNKAKLQAAMGDKAGAKATALQSIELAKAAGNDDYVALNNKLIATL
ncbi:DUF2911 domain-containing protein [Chitinophaga pendula]|uniref:DUF2911 domain-containing protein n=1 Tax=Chitinophaga TaxID=79328 RepID=UPI000BAEC975|nr:MULTISPECIES: DUF2911 domain-containing protein [Chitinophaga]ASZ12808.1 hypothetical protein CK934_18530 [Chitinophaga sp. MD30]UCJ09567.1 DUF2911 domain-containing protein [Chitinophaga pendula]